MSSQRLTDEELNAIEHQCDGFSMLLLNPAAQRDVMAMIAELRERRASHPARGVVAVLNDDGQMRRVFVTGRELDFLRTLVFLLNKHSHEPYAYDGEECDEGVAVLARLVES